MARMIPPSGPLKNDSLTAEPAFYRALQQQLPDDFTVIHSLPWLSQAASEIDRRPVPTGEIDFLILHPTFGILAVEVKGGKLRYEQHEFVYPNGTRIDPVRQVRRGVHGLAQWLFGASKQGYRIGYALAFPESLMQGRALPPALIDGTKNPPQPICIDRTDLPYIRLRIEGIMKYWQQALGSQPLTNHQIQKIIAFLCPIADYSPTWMERITENTERWLLLTSEQTKRISQLSICHRSVLTGRSGTGKTLLAMIQARQFSQEGKKVLFLVYNVQLASAVRDDLADLPTLHVIHFHDLCRTAARNLGQPADTQEREWYKETAPRLLKQAIDQNKLPLFDALIIDEAQVLAEEWLRDLERWFADKPILACCDEFQAFSFEHRTPASVIAEIIHTPKSPYVLTVNMRSPRPVFERLSRIQEPSYEQISLRPDEPDALQEIASITPLKQLHQTIQQLHEEGIPAQAILVLYLKELPDYQPGTSALIGQTISIYRCRGIESPVVIVWSDGKAPETEMACAYSRATSRCIVIYNFFSFLSDQQSLFLLHVQREVPSINQWIDRVWPPTKRLDLVPIEAAGATLTWSKQWKGWLLQEGTDGVADDLWIGHLIFTSQRPVYTVKFLHPKLPPYYVWKHLPSSTLNNPATRETVLLYWCERCDWWGRIQREKDDSSTCLDCRERFSKSMDELFSQGESEIPEEQDMPTEVISGQETVFTQLLYQWRNLVAEQQQALSSHLASSGTGWNNPLQTLARIVTGIEIITSPVGHVLRNKELQQRTWEKYPWLVDRGDQAIWNRCIASNMGIWKERRWLEKQEKGYYIVIGLPNKL